MTVWIRLTIVLATLHITTEWDKKINKRIEEIFSFL